MLKALAGQEPPPELVEVIYAETEGDPFFTEEVFKHLAEEGRLFDADGRFRDGVAAADHGRPGGRPGRRRGAVAAAGRGRRAALGAAAVLGRVFDFELLRQVEELPEDRLIDLIDEAQRAGLVIPVAAPAGEDRYMFAHELIRQTVRGGLSGPRRRRLHARAADALERFHAVALEPHAATIAHHLLEAGNAVDAKRTFRYLCLAGGWALKTAAFEEALTHLEAAAGRMDVATPPERAQLLAQIGTARRSTGQWLDAIETWQDAFDAYRALDEVEAAGLVCADAAYSLAVGGARLEEARAWVDGGSPSRRNA